MRDCTPQPLPPKHPLVVNDSVPTDQGSNTRPAIARALEPHQPRRSLMPHYVPDQTWQTARLPPLPHAIPQGLSRQHRTHLTHRTRRQKGSADQSQLSRDRGIYAPIPGILTSPKRRESMHSTDLYQEPTRRNQPCLPAELLGRFRGARGKHAHTWIKVLTSGTVKRHTLVCSLGSELPPRAIAGHGGSWQVMAEVGRKPPRGYKIRQNWCRLGHSDQLLAANQPQPIRRTPPNHFSKTEGRYFTPCRHPRLIQSPPPPLPRNASSEIPSAEPSIRRLIRGRKLVDVPGVPGQAVAGTCSTSRRAPSVHNAPAAAARHSS